MNTSTEMSEAQLTKQQLTKVFYDNLVELSLVLPGVTLSKREFKKSLTFAKNNLSEKEHDQYLKLYNNYFTDSKDDIEEEEETSKLDISKEDQRYVKRICGNSNLVLDEKLEILVKHLNITKEEVLEYIEIVGVSLSPSQFSAAKLHTLKTKKRYIISSAQTASPVNEEFLKNIEAYAKFIDAEIGIIATRYRNPTSIWAEEGDVWDTKVHPYLTANRQLLHNDLILLADLKIQATSPSPTSGVELFGGHASVIVGSPKIEMRPVAVLPEQKQKFLFSTGSVTVPSFTDSVAGGKAGENHSYGFVIVEIESDDVVHMRSVSADSNGNFNDLIYRVENEQITNETVECLVWGDSHFAQKEERVTLAFRNLCLDLGIEMSVLHDVWDSESLNVHNTKNAVVQHQLMTEDKDNLKKELEQMKEELQWFETHMDKTLVIASNHDDMLDRAMWQGDWRDNLKNAVIFVDMLKLTLSGKAKDGVIPYTINNTFKKVKALGVNDSYIHRDVELALHGHKGPNGSKGSAGGFSKLSTRTIIGHGHAPQIIGGCYQVGISCAMQHGYNKGLSGWAYNGVTLNKYGKRQSITFNKTTMTYTTLY